MLSEKQFRERARSELRQIGEQLKAMATDRAVYWKLENEIVGRNPHLHNARSAFLDMVRGCYADAMTARVLRLLEPGENDASLERVLRQLLNYPELMHDRTSESEYAQDCRALRGAAVNLRAVMLPRIAHHERTLAALASTARALDTAIDLMLAMVKTYYWIIADSCIDVEPGCEEDAMAIFQFAWAVPALAK